LSPLEISALLQSLSVTVNQVKLIDTTGNFGLFHPLAIKPNRLPLLPNQQMPKAGFEIVSYKTRHDGSVRFIKIAPRPEPKWQRCYRTLHGGLTLFQSDSVLSSVGD